MQARARRGTSLKQLQWAIVVNVIAFVKRAARPSGVLVKIKGFVERAARPSGILEKISDVFRAGSAPVRRLDRVQLQTRRRAKTPVCQM